MFSAVFRIWLYKFLVFYGQSSKKREITNKNLYGETLVFVCTIPLILKLKTRKKFFPRIFFVFFFEFYVVGNRKKNEQKAHLKYQKLQKKFFLAFFGSFHHICMLFGAYQILNFTLGWACQMIRWSGDNNAILVTGYGFLEKLVSGISEQRTEKNGKLKFSSTTLRNPVFFWMRKW